MQENHWDLHTYCESGDFSEIFYQFKNSQIILDISGR